MHMSRLKNDSGRLERNDYALGDNVLSLDLVTKDKFSCIETK